MREYMLISSAIVRQMCRKQFFLRAESEALHDAADGKRLAAVKRFWMTF